MKEKTKSYNQLELLYLPYSSYTSTRNSPDHGSQISHWFPNSDFGDQHHWASLFAINNRDSPCSSLPLSLPLVFLRRVFLAVMHFSSPENEMIPRSSLPQRKTGKTHKTAHIHPISMRLPTGGALNFECVKVWFFGRVEWLEIGDAVHFF